MGLLGTDKQPANALLQPRSITICFPAALSPGAAPRLGLNHSRLLPLLANEEPDPAARLGRRMLPAARVPPAPSRHRPFGDSELK